MSPEEKEKIKSYPELSEENIKLIFIRDRSKKAYKEDKIIDSTRETLKEIIEQGTIAGMNKDEIGIHLEHLERCRSWLSAHIQGLKIAFTEEQEPKIKAKREKEERERNPKTVEGILAKYGIKGPEMSVEQNTNIQLPKPQFAEKIICPKCNKETFSLTFHTC